MWLFIFHRMSRPQKRRFQNHDEKKEKYNSTISSSIADIIRFSLDDQFRSKCFQLMQVDNTNDFQLAIKQKLDLLTTPCSSTSHSLQKRPSFHDDEAERVIVCPERKEMIPQVDVEKQANEVDNTKDFQLAVKQELDLHDTPCSSSSHSLQKRPSFHDDEAERVIICPDRNEMIPHVDVEKQADKNIEVLNPLSENIPDTHIDEIAKVLKMTNIEMEENIEENHKQSGTSENALKTLTEAKRIKKVISMRNITPKNVKCNNDESRENMDGFWPTEECCLWDSNNMQESNEAELLLQQEIDDMDLNEDDTDWQ